MTRTLSVASQLALDACNQFPSAPTRSIATILWERDKACFTSYEHARGLVRYHRGESGDADRKKVAEIIPTTKFKAPPSDAKPPKPYVWTHEGVGTILADVHLPYHDEDALDTAVCYAMEHDATAFLLILGDFIDHYSLSRFVRDPRRRRFPEEVELARDTLAALGEVFDTVVYKAGNHERRYIDYMCTKAPELLGLPGFEYDAVMGLDDLGAAWVNWNRVIHVGEHLTLLHGDEYGGGRGSPVNAARGLLLRAKTCAMCGHFHTTSEQPGKTIRQDSLFCWSLGCLCDLHPEYAPLNEWNHGFALLDYRGGDDWEVENRRIVGGKVR